MTQAQLNSLSFNQKIFVVCPNYIFNCLVKFVKGEAVTSNLEGKIGCLSFTLKNLEIGKNLFFSEEDAIKARKKMNS